MNGLVNAPDDVHGLFRVGSNDNAVGVQQVVHGASFPQEFWIGDNVELNIRPRIVLDGLADFFPGLTGTVDLSTMTLYPISGWSAWAISLATFSM